MNDLIRFIPAPPIGPGDVLRERILAELKLTQDQLASALRVSRLTVSQIVNGRRSITADMALRLARVTSTTPDLWLNLQRDVDIYNAELKLSEELPQLAVLRAPKDEQELILKVDDAS